jgi:ribose/xylose/arabinose/galactoside ABC-type transport system permease subunit
LKPTLLAIALLAQVLLFGFLDTGPEGLDFARTGGPLSYFGSYFLDSIAHAGPMILLTLGFLLTAGSRGVDLSLVSIAAVAGCILSRFSTGSLLTLGVPAALVIAVALGFLNGFAVARFGYLVTLISLVLFRAAAYAVGANADNPPFLLAGGYEHFGRSFGVFATAIPLYGLVFLFQKFPRMLHTSTACPRAAVAGNAAPAGAAPCPPLRVYGPAAITAAFAAIVYTASRGEAAPGMLAGVEIPCLASLLLAGATLNRPASAASTLLAAFNIAVLSEGLTHLYLRTT